MTERDYVLGTHAQEVKRLGLQHEVWRGRVLDAWRRAGIGEGATVLDVGAGPGHASVDLAGIVGPSGRVVALERSRAFLSALEERAARLGLANIEVRECDVAEQDFGDALADAAWVRWLLCFIAEPQRIVARIARVLKPGGVAVFHEYGDYETWQMMPPNGDIERFRGLVVKSWRDAGGEPDVGAQLPRMCAEEGLEVISVRPLVDTVRRGSDIWNWPAAFMAVNADRMRALGYIDAAEAERLATVLDRVDETSWMITPLVVEVIARRPGSEPAC